MVPVMAGSVSQTKGIPESQAMQMAKEIMSGSARGKKMVENMVQEIKDELQQQDFEDAMGGEDDDDDDDMDDFLKSLGIGYYEPLNRGVYYLKQVSIFILYEFN
jgi:hypothetical protein